MNRISPKRKIGIAIVVHIMLLASAPCLARTDIYRNYTQSSEILDGNSEVEYRISASLIRQWNYTVEENHIRTHNGTLYYEQEVENEILIRIEVIEVDERISFQIDYEANTPTGYYIDTSYTVELNPETGYCIIKNGPLEGFYGRLSLFFNYEQPDVGMTISSIAESEIVVTRLLGKSGIQIMDEYQTAERYNCSHNDSVIGEADHLRYYESDTSLFCRAVDSISDLILLGMANISYAYGFLYLESTNIELGEPFWVPIDLGAFVAPFLAISGITIFGVLYVLIYRAQRKQNRHS